jgi:RimJ/RimL family protein N-acetyltransferase
MTDASMFDAKCVESERVRLRKPHDADIEGIVETQTDERVRSYLGGPRPEQEVRGFVESVGVSTLMAEPGCFIVAIKETDEMLGTILLNRRDPDKSGHIESGGNELELTYVFRHHAWGKGYATEAARAVLRAAAAELPDQPVLIITQSANHASLNLAGRLGFEVVTTFEEHDAEQTLAVACLRSFHAP